MECEKQKKRLQQGVSVVITVFLVLSLVLCLYAVAQVLNNGYVNIGGFMVFRVVTGSMEPSISTGSLLVAREVAIETVEVGDIVCFLSDEEAISGMVVTHRVQQVLTGFAGEVLLETKGDANLALDSDYVTAENLIGKVIWHTGESSLIASIVSIFSSNIGFLGCIIFPILLLAGLILRDSIKGIRRELEEFQKTSDQPAPDPLCGMTQEEYDEMYQRIKAEIMEELKHCAEIQDKQSEGIVDPENN